MLRFESLYVIEKYTFEIVKKDYFSKNIASLHIEEVKVNKDFYGKRYE